MKKVIFLIAATAIVYITKMYAQQSHPPTEMPYNVSSGKGYPQLPGFSHKELNKETVDFIAKYAFNDVSYRVGYDKNGNWLYTIRTYAENKLPRNVRLIAKRSYKDYHITLVEEIEQPSDSFTYIIHLEGKTAWINLRVCNGEIDEWQKFNKPEN
ncbi:MAG TPA: hypothetical protein VGQ09_15330 [Chitinophagaceae bacterium]|jgi:hypothetical protein|nr:hypothetical protein [Chitinophagaceae bacterium]